MATSTKSRKRRVKKLTPEVRLKELEAFIDLCFYILGDHDDKEICNLTGLSLSTIKRYKAGEYTLASQFGTVQAIGAAAGLQIEMNETAVRVAIVN